MKFKMITVECTQCGHQNEKLVTLYHPNAFTKPEEASCLSQFWCNGCDLPQAVRYRFFLNKKNEPDAVVGTRIKPSSIFAPKKPETGIMIKPRNRRGK